MLQFDEAWDAQVTPASFRNVPVDEMNFIGRDANRFYLRTKQDKLGHLFSDRP